MGKGQSGFEAGIDKQLTAFIDLIECKYVSDDINFRPIDFAHRSQFFTLDVISQIAYSEPFGFLANDKDMHNFICINVKPTNESNALRCRRCLRRLNRLAASHWLCV